MEIDTLSIKKRKKKLCTLSTIAVSRSHSVICIHLLPTLPGYVAGVTYPYRIRIRIGAYPYVSSVLSILKQIKQLRILSRYVLIRPDTRGYRSATQPYRYCAASQSPPPPYAARNAAACAEPPCRRGLCLRFHQRRCRRAQANPPPSPGSGTAPPLPQRRAPSGASKSSSITRLRDCWPPSQTSACARRRL